MVLKYKLAENIALKNIHTHIQNKIVTETCLFKKYYQKHTSA